MALYQEDIVEIDMNRAGFHRSFLNHSIGRDDTCANRFGVRLVRMGEPVNLGSATCEGFFLSPSGNHIVISGQYAQTDGNMAYVELPAACYDYEGPFTLAIKVVGGGVTGTVRMVDGQIVNTFTDGAVAPVGSVPTYQEVLAVYDQMLAAKAGSVRYDIEQELTTAQRTQARNNIGMIQVSFDQADGDDYIATFATECQWTQVSGDDYMLVTMAD